jgi:epoxyqueuosine reductase
MVNKMTERGGILKVLLHICCAPCTIYPLKELRKEGNEVTGFFYNPNIHPYTEFQKRLQTLENYAKIVFLPLTVEKGYDLEQFLRGALDLGKDRCLFCYRVRLERAFRQAVASEADAVTTTLLYSRYQRHEDIRSIGEELSQSHSLPFLYRDFRTGWNAGIQESKQLNMYRQNYCGCIFSERERFGGK